LETSRTHSFILYVLKLLANSRTPFAYVITIPKISFKQTPRQNSTDSLKNHNTIDLSFFFMQTAQLFLGGKPLNPRVGVAEVWVNDPSAKQNNAFCFFFWKKKNIRQLEWDVMFGFSGISLNKPIELSKSFVLFRGNTGCP
jgi:hypothetical protein